VAWTRVAADKSIDFGSANPASGSQIECVNGKPNRDGLCGDTRHIFNNQNCAEVVKAEQRFREMTGAGFTAAVRSGPGEQRIIRSFDPTAEESASGWRLTAVSQQILLGLGASKKQVVTRRRETVMTCAEPDRR